MRKQRTEMEQVEAACGLLLILAALLYVTACVQGTPVEPEHAECRITLYLAPRVENDRIIMHTDSGSITRSCG